MKVSVVIPVFNEEKHIAACLESLKNQIEKPDEVIVIDNNCTDKTIDIARTFDVIIIHEKRQGIIHARNKGFNLAKYDILARTDADTQVPRTWIKRIKVDFEDPAIVGLSGRAYFYGLPSFINPPYWPPSAFLKAAKKTFESDFMFGPNMALRKSAWEQIKDDVCLNDKEVHEDIDLATHLREAGEIKFDPYLRVLSSPRRFKKLYPYFEYPYRYLKTVHKHKRLLPPMPSLDEKTMVIGKKLHKAVKHIAKQIAS